MHLLSIILVGLALMDDTKGEADAKYSKEVSAVIENMKSQTLREAARKSSHLLIGGNAIETREAALFFADLGADRVLVASLHSLGSPYIQRDVVAALCSCTKRDDPILIRYLVSELRDQPDFLEGGSEELLQGELYYTDLLRFAERHTGLNLQADLPFSYTTRSTELRRNPKHADDVARLTDPALANKNRLMRVADELEAWLDARTK